MDELKGADRQVLKTRVELLLYEAFPRTSRTKAAEFQADSFHVAHPHLALSLPKLRGLSTQPTVYEQIPDLGKLLTKLQATIKFLNLPISAYGLNGVTAAIQTKKDGPVNEQTVAEFVKASDAIRVAVAPQELFPLVDLWRLALLASGFAAWCAVNSTGLVDLISTVADHMQQLGAASPKPLSLTSLRLLSNISANSALLRQVVTGRERRSNFTQVVVAGLLHDDTNVRTAASTLVFNMSSYLQRSRRQAPSRPDPVEDGDWEVEVLTAIIETLSKESDSGIGRWFPESCREKGLTFNFCSASAGVRLWIHGLTLSLVRRTNRALFGGVGCPKRDGDCDIVHQGGRCTGDCKGVYCALWSRIDGTFLVL